MPDYLMEKEQKGVLEIHTEAKEELEKISREATKLEEQLQMLDKRRTDLQRTIWLAELALRPDKEAQATLAPEKTERKDYSKMTIAQACEDVLRSSTRMMPAREIYEALKEGGKDFSGSKHPVLTISTTLKRDADKFTKRLYDGANRFALKKEPANNEEGNMPKVRTIRFQKTKK